MQAERVILPVNQEGGKVIEATAHRLTMAEVIKHGNWLVGRITARWPHITQQRALGWIRTVMDDSANFLLISNGGGVALCEQTRMNMSPVPVVYERFVLAWGPEHIPVAAFLYRDIYRWADTIGAKEIHVENFSDIPRPLIRKYINKPLYERTIMFVNVGREE